MLKAVFFAFAFLGHALWLQWILHHFPKAKKHKPWLFGIAAFLSLISPVLRAIPIAADWKPKVLAVSAFELMFVVLCGVPLFLWTLVVRHFPAGFLSKGRDEATKSTHSSASAVSPSAESTASAAAPSAAGDSRASSLATSNTNIADAIAGSASAESEVPLFTRRNAIEKVGGMVVAGSAASLLGWGNLRGRFDFEVTETIVRIKGLPRALDGYTLVHLSDIHVGAFVDESHLRRGFSLADDLKADLAVLTGDLIDHDPSYLPLAARAFSSLKARDGVVAILGNHDYYTGASNVTNALEKAGVRTLVNRAFVHRSGDGGGFLLAGTDDFQGRGSREGAGGPDLMRATGGRHKDMPTILLAHQPHYFKDVKGEIALQLSGHLHGGQINPGFKPGKLLVPLFEGRYDQNGSSLYISRGFGTAGPPTRVFARPEIGKIVLVSA